MIFDLESATGNRQSTIVWENNESTKIFFGLF
jgi:hypothetical protein